MANVLLIILLIISVILIGLILIQRSEGGALGIGGGGGGGGFMSGRGTADLVSRMTSVFGAAFLLVTLLISIAFNYEQSGKGLLDTQNAEDALVKDVTPADSVDKIEKALLNNTSTSGNTATPLEADSKTPESNTEVQEKPKKDEG